MRLVPKFRMTPQSRNGDAIAVGSVSIPLIFEPPGPPPPPVAELDPKGLVRLSCHVLANGTLEQCRVVSETPEGQGWGENALKMTPRMKFKPEIRNGVPVDSTREFPVIFRYD